MQTREIQLNELHVSPLNMRAEKKPPTLARMAEIAADLLPSVKDKGILQNLVVRPNNQGFEILAGRRRYYGARVIEAEQGSFPAIRCEVLEPGDDAAALEVSLIENMAREDIDEIAAFEVYAKLILAGRTPQQIAATFGLGEQQVRQRLAIANLLPRIRKLYREGEIDAADLRSLTLATKARQRDYLALHDEHRAPRGRYLREWMFGGGAIATKNALFPLDAYQGAIRQDLFGEEAYFVDVEMFWSLQDSVIAEKRDAYLAEGWSGVVILGRGERFNNWNFARTKKKEGGHVYVEVSRTGEVVAHVGYRSHDELRKEKLREERKQRSAAGADSGVTAPLSKKMHNYIDLHRQAAVRVALLGAPRVALSLLLAHALASSGNWSVRADKGRADSQAIRDSVEASSARPVFSTERLAIAALLGEEDADRPLTARNVGNDEVTARLFERLAGLDLDMLVRLAAFIMAETITPGSASVEAAGRHLQVDLRRHWTPDATFFEAMRDRAGLNTLLADVAGKKQAASLVSAKAREQRSALLAAVAKRPEWCPEFMRFDAN